ncbi:outer membrane protein assembly factor BamA [Nitratireductor aquimarinus]|uniref:outer membrane protein assembly factor BamA n=1 Tax=Nitratireductor TaxID=245876 RepID=UPI0019D36138|nr:MULTISPECIES: outer membrane protein assembly factor BamA [Nitratireductor]MBN7776843.1 outer membrane protein assembly factor BamA [Nitratireductor pacificus]MBN7780177.1 outer membrane protein assembly factor BamA [Nitratireductor pacificus]MBN7788984.1 outer membrane protein assembly factor BamA [Nitratireductor aquimarinus]MBY6099052.1 outer membrane protein assembly factor BamA [Nitratireductor aquimarinus]MCA1260706.1 outer membrane protein assembly factor BamA [Nitratireductor aquima
MKASSSFKNAVSAVALSAGLAMTGTVAVQLAAMEAAEAATVSRIEVRGNRRVEDETIRNYIDIRPGRSFSNDDVNEAVKRLFATGLFADVSISQSGGALIVTVDEYSIVNQVIFQGNKKIKDANLARAVQLQPRKSFSNQSLQADEETIREAYRRIGRDDATVTGRTQALDDGRVNVIFEVQEGGRTKIAAINFVGNEAFGNGRLRDVISTKQSNFLSFLMRDDIYDDNRLRADEETLRRFYYNRGYADFRVISATADLDEVENAYTVTFTVDEGERYRFGNIGVESTVTGIDTDALNAEIKTRQGNVYSAKNVEDSIIALTENVAGKGYAFAQVTPRGNRNFETREIDVVYSIDEGPRAYIQRIEIRGNQRTRDYVIRREFDLSEGDAFNQVLVQRAKRRLEGLNFFQTVNISTVPGSQPDQVILVVDVVEKSTGEFSIGAGYSTASGDSSSGGFSVEGSVTERNFLGRGQFVRIAAGGGKDSRDYSFSFTEPYFLGRRISAGFDVYRRTRKFDDKYDRDTTGATIRFGLPITEALSSQLAYNFSQEEYTGVGDCVDPYDASCNLAPALQDAIDDGKWIKSSVSGSLVYNTIDDMKNPHSGLYANLTLEVAGLGGDAKFVKATARGTYYQTLSEELDLVGLFTVGAGHIQALDGDLRVFDHFSSSDRIIRGFDYNGIGPYQNASGGGIDHIGGKTYFNASAEAQFPFPVLPESFGLRGAVFADAATLYGSDIAGAIGTDLQWRASVGAGLIWASPFGPLRVDYAYPILKEDTDDVQNFNFGISTRF